jgi:hypothetical protein
LAVGVFVLSCLVDATRTSAEEAGQPPRPAATSEKRPMPTAEDTCDFSRSFITFVLPGGKNNARIQAEARCVILDRKTQKRDDYYLVASCKGEDTYGKGPLFLVPNYDFCMIYSRTEFRIIRVHSNHERDVETVGGIADRFEAVRFQIKDVPCDVLCDNKAVVEATLSGRPLNGRVTIVDPTKRYEATIEFPIKTMNVNANEGMFQVDTGPVLLPNWNAEKARWVERFDLAYVAYNGPNQAHFVVQEPTPVVGGDPKSPQVSHYSRTTHQDASCSVLAPR